MKLRFVNFIVVLAILASIFNFGTFAEDNENTYTYEELSTNGKVKLEWEITPVSVTCDVNKSWDTENLCWVENKENYSATPGSAEFKFTNYSSNYIKASVSFTPSLGMDEYIDGEVTFNNNNSVLYSVLDTTKTTYFESDFSKVTISSTVKVKNPEDLVSTNSVILGIFTTTIENFNPFACILSGSKVSLADGSTKLIDDVTTSDKLMTFNFYEGKLDGNYPMYVMKHEDVLSSVITVMLDNGTVLEMCDWQQFFDMDSKSYFDINAENYKDSIGRNIMFIDDRVVSSSKIRDASLEVRFCTSYEIFTEYNKNFVANGVLTVEPETYLDGVYTIGDDLRIDYDQYLKDVESYGRYTYEEFSDIMTEHQFNVLNIADKKIAVGKGIIDEKWLFDLYRQWMPLYN